MRVFKTAVISLMLLVMSLSLGAKPKVRIVATGGTIAGVSTSSSNSSYAAGQVGIQALIDAVPQILTLADVSGEQLVNIGSQDMNDEVWLKLSRRVNELLNTEGYDAVLITHGTDTMEETAYFLNLTVKSDKPVVLVGSMRPSDAISPDGPANLYNAVAVAVSPYSKGMGVVCCMNNQILDAKTVIKTHTIDCDTFEGGPSGIIGYVYNGEAHYLQTPNNRHTVNSVFDVSDLDKLPKVGIVYGYANASPLPMLAFVDAGFDGIVLAGVGDG
ncbi:MAG: type II asparaginase, partial [Bacteroidales bacterium]|nr:type II asparaginase [Bacteroidales bacterium]